MNRATTVASAPTLKSAPDDALDDAQLARLVESCGCQTARRGHLIIAIGDTASDEYFLLEGEVELTARDGHRRRLVGGSDATRVPLARLRPRQYEVRACGKVTFVKATPAQLRAVIDAGAHHPVLDENHHENYEVEELFHGLGPAATDVFLDFVEAVQGDRIRLPTLPEIAMRIRTALQSQDVGAAEIGAMVAADPAIAAKLVRLANSAAYRRGGKVVTVEGAVARIGLDATRNVVTAFCVNELFETELASLSAWLASICAHSREVAATSFVLSRELRLLDPEQALLAGLLHEVGLIPLLVFAENYPELTSDPDAVQALLDEGECQASEMLLSSWGFGEELIDVVRHVRNWHHRHDGGASYCDLVQVAKAHCMINAHDPRAPRLRDLAAFERLDGLNVEGSMQLLKQARESLGVARALLG